MGIYSGRRKNSRRSIKRSWASYRESRFTGPTLSGWWKTSGLPVNRELGTAGLNVRLNWQNTPGAREPLTQPGTLFMPDWFSRPTPYVLLIAGVIFFSAAVVFRYTGKAWVRFHGWAYRAEEPGWFWWQVALKRLFSILIQRQQGSEVSPSRRHWFAAHCSPASRARARPQRLSGPWLART